MLRHIDLLPSAKGSLPDAVESFIVEAERRIDAFIHERQGRLIHSFVPSDFRADYRVLEAIQQRQLASGPSFCEWGSGFGVVAGLAAMQGFHACGIEVESELVEHAERLANDFQVPTQFALGSAIPERWEHLADRLDEMTAVDTDAPNGYDALGLEPDDFDVIFTFPWPGEEKFWETLFDRCAATGALLLTYHGGEGFRLQRKVRR